MYTPGSGSYHKFLTPKQFKAKYAPTHAKVKAVKKYLRSAGLTHVKTANNRQLVTATATVAAAIKAFHTGFSTYQAGKKSFYTNTRAAAVPAKLSKLVTAIVGLSDAPLPMPRPLGREEGR